MKYTALLTSALQKGLPSLLKSEPDIYQHVLTTLDVEPDQVLFLDDNSDNVKGARELGIAAHVVNGFDQLKHFLKVQGIIDKK